MTGDIDTATRRNLLPQLSLLLSVCLVASCDLKPVPDDLIPEVSRFMATDSRSAEALRVLELQNEFIVFNRFFVYRIEKNNGTVAAHKDLRLTIPGFLFADVEKFQDGTMLVTSTNGGFSFLDGNLNLFTSDRNTPFGVMHGTFLDTDDEVRFIAGVEDDAMIGPLGFFWPEGVIPFIFTFMGYTTHTIDATFAISPPNHLTTDTKAVFSLMKASANPRPCSVVCYTRESLERDWLVDFPDFCPRGFAESSNGNILAYGLENTNSVLYTLSGATGSTSGFKTLCMNSAETPGDVVGTTDGGFAIVSTVNATNVSCTTVEINGINDIRLIKLNASLNVTWEQVYDVPLRQQVYHLIQTSDGGFAIAGRTELNSIDQFLLLKTDAEGNLMP